MEGRCDEYTPTSNTNNTATATTHSRITSDREPFSFVEWRTLIFITSYLHPVYILLSCCWMEKCGGFWFLLLMGSEAKVKVSHRHNHLSLSLEKFHLETEIWFDSVVLLPRRREDRCGWRVGWMRKRPSHSRFCTGSVQPGNETWKEMEFSLFYNLFLISWQIKVRHRRWHHTMTATAFSRPLPIPHLR